MEYMNKQFWPMIWRQFLFGFAFNLLLAFVLVKLFGSEDGWQSEVLFVFLGIIALEIVLGIKAWLAKGAWAFLFGKRFIEQGVFEALKEAELPAPLEYHRRGFDYLADLADDESANPTHRVKAAVLFSGMSATWSREGVLRSAAFQGAADEAMSRWLGQVPRSTG